jgi:hypothetical protein
MIPQSAALQPDFAAAEAFLTALDEGAEQFTFQTFDDSKQRKDRALAVVLTGTFELHRNTLAKLNAAGAGVFVTVNVTDGKGRKLENIQRIRAVWHEDDEGVAIDFPLEPHITVESSPGKHHRYWLVDGLTMEEFGGVMRWMVGHGSDPNAKDVARVLRLPGFCHLKNSAAPHRVRVAAKSGALPYAAAEVLRAFPAPVQPEAAKSHATDAIQIDRAKLQEIRSALSFIAPTDRDTWLAVGMALHSTGAGQQAFGLWDEWSQKTERDNYDPKGMQYTWASFGKRAGSLTTLATLFQLATAAGWVKPSLPRRTAEVTDIRGENARRIEYEKRIRDADGDQGALLYEITPEILDSDMREATKSLLLKQISEATGVPKGALMADGPKRAADADEGGAERAANFMPELNERHAVVPIGGRTLILNREFDPGLKRPLLTFSARQDFITRYENRSTRKSGEEIDIGTYWLKSSKRRQYDGVLFMPGRDVPGYYNLWTGWGVQPKQGSCEKFFAFVRDVICDHDRDKLRYVWGWMAHLFQRPHELPGTALVMRGGEGIGKNTFAEALGRLVGAHFIVLNSINQVTGRFSGHLADTLLVYANEAIWGGDKQAEGPLRAMITDPYSPIEAKGKDIRTTVNYKRLIAASNSDWVVPRGKGDRRFVVLDVPDTHKEDREYFGAIKQELRAGGYAALMHELLTTPLKAFDPARIPASVRECGWDLAVRSANSMQRWWYDCIDRGWMTRQSPEETMQGEERCDWPDFLDADHVKALYLKWCERHRIHHPETPETLGKALRQEFGLKKFRPRQAWGRSYAYKFPSLDEARARFGKAFGIPSVEWERMDIVDA